MALARERYAKWLLPTDDRRVRQHRDEVLAFATSPLWPEPRPVQDEILVAEAKVEPAVPVTSYRPHRQVRPNPDNVRRLLAETRGGAPSRPVERVVALEKPAVSAAQPKSRRELLSIFEELSQMSDRLSDNWSSSG